MPAVGKKIHGGPFTELAAIVGVYAATMLCQEFGGLEDIHIPKEAGKGKRRSRVYTRLVALIGETKTELLMRELGGIRLKIPKPPREVKKLSIIEAIDLGNEGHQAIAKRLGVHQRYVRMVRAALRGAK